MTFGFWSFVALLMFCVIKSVVTWPSLDTIGLVLAGCTLLSTLPYLNSRERRHLLSTLWIPVFSFFLIGLWIVAQWAPIGILANPLWKSTAEALGKPVSGRISVDPSATFQTLASVVLAAALLISGAIMALDRRRMDRCFLIAGFAILSSSLTSTLLGASTAFDAIGAILCVGYAYFFFERFETRSAHISSPGLKLAAIETSLLLLFGLFIGHCALSGRSDTSIAAATGSILLLGLILLRRLILPLWGIILSASCVGIGAVLLLVSIGRHGMPISLAYSSASLAVRDVSLRMMSDAPLVGIGAGAANSFAHLYLTFHDDPSFMSASNYSRMNIEIGWIASIVVIVSLLAIVLVLVRGALNRGRDAVFPMTGAALMAMLLVGGLLGDSFEGSSISILTAIVGIALTQSQTQQRT